MRLVWRMILSSIFTGLLSVITGLELSKAADIDVDYSRSSLLLSSRLHLHLARRHLTEELSNLYVATEKPSPTPTREETRVFGVGFGVFFLFVSGLACSLLFYDLYQGNNIRNPKLYQKPYNTCVLCLFFYGLIVIYVFEAPRESRTVEPRETVSTASGTFVFSFPMSPYLYTHVCL